MTMSPLPICLMGLVAQIGLSQPAVAQSNAPASQPLLMDREKEIALVLSACPPALASKAAVYVLDERAMSRSATARTVSRQSFSTRLRPLRSRNAWTSKARTLVPRILKMAELRAQGNNPEEIKRFVADAFAKGSSARRPGRGSTTVHRERGAARPGKGHRRAFPSARPVLRSLPDQRRPRLTKPRLAGLRRRLRHAQRSDHRACTRRGTGWAGIRTPLIVEKKGDENCPPRRISIVVRLFEVPNQGGFR